MKNKLIKIAKYNKFVNTIYTFFGTILIKILKIFIKPQDNTFLFVSFGGKKFDDSPKAIYTMMRKDPRFVNSKMYWAFKEPESIQEFDGEKVKIDTIAYYILALRATCWITNSNIERGLNFKGRKTFYFNTWHGTPIKMIGNDMKESKKRQVKLQSSRVDLMTAQSKYEAKINSKAFNLDIKKFSISGLPRNDYLTKFTESEERNIKNALNIPENKKIILYAPTYREFERDNNQNCVISSPIDFNKWESELGKEYIILFRAHYEVSKILNFKKNNFVYDVSSYPFLNDLLIISNILVSDYSSIFFDYSILERPMFHFTYDYDLYMNKRGLYFDIRHYIDGSSSENELLNKIKENSGFRNIQNVKKFKEKFVENYGNSTSVALDLIYENTK